MFWFRGHLRPHRFVPCAAALVLAVLPAIALAAGLPSSAMSPSLARPLPAVDGAASIALPSSLWTTRGDERIELGRPDELIVAAFHEATPSSEMLGETQVAGSRTYQPLTSDYDPSERWCLQVLPSGLIYRSYLAGVREPRFASAWVHERDLGWIWDISLGGRVGILRYGTQDSRWPQGWQLDIEGAGLPRLFQNHGGWDLMAADFRFGIPVTYGRGRYQFKIGYYHLSSHLGDEFMLVHPGTRRINYARDSFLWGNSYYWTRDLRLYGEVAWAFGTDGGAEPWQFQVGIDYSPDRPGKLSGSPFFAINADLREEHNFGGNMVVQTGWQWQGVTAGQLFRMGMQYFAGMSEQYEFYDKYEEKVGLALWYDY